jgi:hypothetical protein
LLWEGTVPREWSVPGAFAFYSARANAGRRSRDGNDRSARGARRDLCPPCRRRAPPRGRRRGLVHCCFHKDHTASLSVDLDRGLFNCFGCGAQGGVRKFAELVGEAPAVPAAGAPAIALTVRGLAIRAARCQAWTRPGVIECYRVSDEIRRRHRAVEKARRVATTAGPTERAWDLLETAVDLEHQAWALEGELDAAAVA